MMSVFDDHGTSLVETVVASALMLVVLAGIGALSVTGMIATENDGHLAARTTEYAQDKMEQLLALAYGDATSDTRVFPATTAGGTGLTIGGSADPAAAVAGYADYLDKAGNLISNADGSAPAGWFYQRVWAVTSPSANLKQITVTVRVALNLASRRQATSTVTALKTFPF